ncbi:HNH endonuclease [Idiomarina abyssalis]|uniref:HNH endonuclease n=1 Tax=Idiomarina abyssalis TaxID=86102 RepID=UPI003A8F3DD0
MNWTDEELRASISTYLEMQEKQSRGVEFTKKKYYQQLANQYGRTPKAYEYRMQNISHVLALQGRNWIEGLKPAKNVGTKVIASIERLLAELEGQFLGDVAAFQSKVEKAKNNQGQPPKGNRSPSCVQTSITQYVRDPEVVSWVLAEAKGVCECCNQPAPFERADGSPFLEVHHVLRLADGGADTIHNAVAICPNCHRRLHYGADKQQLAGKLLNKKPRLKILKQ